MALLSHHGTFACSCVVVPPIPSALVLSQFADAVFSACVVSVEPLPSPCLRVVAGCVPSGPEVAVTLNVFAAWKGVIGSQVVLFSQPEDSCSYRFEQGREYLVFAHLSPIGVTTSVCSPTRLLSTASQSLSELGTPVATF